jgi:DNA-binding transcriptional regulator YiaG
MLLYPLAEAIVLLAEKLEVAKRSLKNTIEDLEFLREQVTVMEVNFARVHNVSPESIAHTIDRATHT